MKALLPAAVLAVPFLATSCMAAEEISVAVPGIRPGIRNGRMTAQRTRRSQDMSEHGLCLTAGRRAAMLNPLRMRT
jgi:hypothetical protein